METSILMLLLEVLFFSKSKRFASFMVGSALTSKSDPLKEYSECELKAHAMLKVLCKTD